MRIIVDTNVILDFMLLREPHMNDAKDLFMMIVQEEVEAFMTASSITDVYYITEKRLGIGVARGTVKNLLAILGVVAVDGDDCFGALELPIADFEDALITVCANREGIGLIVTNDKEFQKMDTGFVDVVSLRDFLDSLQ